jgi:hypothetical protein
VSHGYIFSLSFLIFLFLKNILTLQRRPEMEAWGWCIGATLKPALGAGPTEIFRDLLLPEEAFRQEIRGGAHRWFRSQNVLDLVKARKTRNGRACLPWPPHQLNLSVETGGNLVERFSRHGDKLRAKLACFDHDAVMELV